LLGQDFAVALLDIRMGGLDGYDLAAAVLEAKGKSAPAIIFVTAFEADETDVVRAYSMGAVDYIYSSSMVPEIIRARVAVLLDEWKRRQTDETSRKRRSEEAPAPAGKRRLVNLSVAARLVAGSDTTLRRWVQEGWIMNLAPPGATRRLVDLRELVLIMGLRFMQRQIDPQLVRLLGLPTDGESPYPDRCQSEVQRVARLLHRQEAALSTSVEVFHRYGYSCEEISSALRRIEKMLETLRAGV
jgi:CheY-like chemotaxis protein